MTLLDKLLLSLMVCWRTLFCVLNHLSAVPTYFFWYVILQPIRIVSPSTFWKMEGLFVESLLSMVALWGQMSGHTVTVSGDDISPMVGQECIVMINHQSTGDIPVVMYALRGIRRALRDVMWVMDWILQSFCFGWVARAHGDFFILQGSDVKTFSMIFRGTLEEVKKSQIEKFKNHLETVFPMRNKKWIIVFPEGGLLRKRRPGSQRFAKKHGLPVLNHVALPRTGVLQTIVDTIGVYKDGEKSLTTNGKIKWIIDITIGYPKNEPFSIVSWTCGNEGGKAVSVHYRIFSAASILQNCDGHNSDRDLISDAWLYERFTEKEKLLDEYFKAGKFPGGKLGQKAVDCFTLRCILGHLFCLLTNAILFYILPTYFWIY